ncbi:hypothetical protein [Streptomyces sp. NPDC048057]|uniref:hypothetical protein n=1 Tax=Streptomyces sp. NPDC048057 TaxID=3155628 RepID=UPI0033F7BA75
MAQTGHAEILDRIAELKKDISGLKTPGKDSKNAKDYVTDAELQAKTEKIIKAVEKGPKKEEKAPWEAILEQLKLGPLAGAIKDFGTGQIVLLGAMGALTLLIMSLGGALNTFSRLVYQPITKLNERRQIRAGTRTDPAEGRVLARNDRGGIERMRPTEAVAAPALRVIRSNIEDEQKFNRIKDALEAVIPKIRKFNEKWGAAPKPGQVKSLAKALDKLNSVLAKPKLDPTHLEKVWKGVGELKTKVDGIDLPKLKDTATAAASLSRSTDNLSTRLGELRSVAQGTAAALGS